MKSHHWQKMNNLFKIVAKTVKLFPLKKKSDTCHFGGWNFFPYLHHQQPQQKNASLSKVPVYWNVSPPAVFVESYKDHWEPLNVDPKYQPR